MILSQVKSFVKHPEWSYNKSIYEVNIRQFSEEGTFKAFEKYLPELKKLGIGIIWFMPVHPIGEKNRKGKLGSYYSVKDYYAVNPEFGSLDDFKSLVMKIHKLGMYVIIDWVANHTAWDNTLAEEHPEWYTKDSLGNFVPPVKDWTDVIDLNYKKKDLWNYMINAMRFWVEECNIDGFRCDVAGMVPTKFWNKARKELDEIKPVFMLAEWETPELHQHAFDMTYSWVFYKIMNKAAKRKKTVGDFVEYFREEDQKYPENAFRMRFTSNHDENSWNGTVFERLGNSSELFAVFSTAVPGMPLIYNGQEAGLNKRLLFFEQDPIKWKDSKFREIYTKLFNLKQKNKAMWNGEKGGEIIWQNVLSNTKSVGTDIDSSICAFVREKNGDKIFVVFNFSGKERNFAIKGEEIRGDYFELFTNEEITFNERESFKLKPWGYKFFVKIKTFH